MPEVKTATSGKPAATPQKPATPAAAPPANVAAKLQAKGAAKPASKSHSTLVYAAVAIGVCVVAALLALLPGGTTVGVASLASTGSGTPLSEGLQQLLNTPSPKTGVANPDAIPRPALAFTDSANIKPIQRGSWQTLVQAYSPADPSVSALVHALAARGLPVIAAGTPLARGLQSLTWRHLREALEGTLKSSCVRSTPLTDCLWSPEDNGRPVDNAELFRSVLDSPANGFFGTATVGFRQVTRAGIQVARALQAVPLTVTADSRVPREALTNERNLTWVQLEPAMQALERWRALGHATDSPADQAAAPLMEYPAEVKKFNYPIGGSASPRIFISSQGTVTGGDAELTHTFFLQALGTQRVYITSPAELARATQASSIIPAEKRRNQLPYPRLTTDAEHRPQPPLLTVSGVLQPGDALYVPAGWSTVFEALSPSATLAAPSFSAELATSQLISKTLQDIVVPFLQGLMSSFIEVYVREVAKAREEAGLPAVAPEELQREAVVEFTPLHQRAIAFLIRRIVVQSNLRNPDDRQAPNWRPTTGGQASARAEFAPSAEVNEADHKYSLSLLSSTSLKGSPLDKLPLRRSSGGGMKALKQEGPPTVAGRFADDDDLVAAATAWVQNLVVNARLLTAGAATDVTHPCHAEVAKAGSLDAFISQAETSCPKRGNITFTLPSWRHGAPVVPGSGVIEDQDKRAETRAALLTALEDSPNLKGIRNNLDAISRLVARVVGLLAPPLKPLPLRQGGVSQHGAALRDSLLASVVEVLGMYVTNNQNTCSYMVCVANPKAFRKL